MGIFGAFDKQKCIKIFLNFLFWNLSFATKKVETYPKNPTNRFRKSNSYQKSKWILFWVTCKIRFSLEITIVSTKGSKRRFLGVSTIKKGMNSPLRLFFQSHHFEYIEFTSIKTILRNQIWKWNKIFQLRKVFVGKSG